MRQRWNQCLCLKKFPDAFSCVPPPAWSIPVPTRFLSFSLDAPKVVVGFLLPLSSESCSAYQNFTEILCRSDRTCVLLEETVHSFPEKAVFFTLEENISTSLGICVGKHVNI